MNYDFIEVGTSDFDTLIQDATDQCIGLCIEPIKFYLDRLPNKPNVKKINSAISFDGKVGRDKVYYIPLETIQKHNMPLWIRGCNSIGDYHYQHKKNNLQSVVETIDVDTIPLGDIFEQHNVDTLTILKIDTEGYEFEVLIGAKDVLSGISIVLFEHHYDDMIKKSYKYADINELLKFNGFVQIYKSKMPFRKTFEYIFLNQKYMNRL